MLDFRAVLWMQYKQPQQEQATQAGRERWREVVARRVCGQQENDLRRQPEAPPSGRHLCAWACLYQQASVHVVTARRAVPRTIGNYCVQEAAADLLHGELRRVRAAGGRSAYAAPSSPYCLAGPAWRATCASSHAGRVCMLAPAPEGTSQGQTPSLQGQQSGSREAAEACRLHTTPLQPSALYTSCLSRCSLPCSSRCPLSCSYRRHFSCLPRRRPSGSSRRPPCRWRRSSCTCSAWRRG